MERDLRKEQKIKLAIVPQNPKVGKVMKKNKVNPNMILLCIKTRSIGSVVKHLLKKWKRFVDDRFPFLLFPKNIPFPHQGWDELCNETIGDIFQNFSSYQKTKNTGKVKGNFFVIYDFKLKEDLPPLPIPKRLTTFSSAAITNIGSKEKEEKKKGNRTRKIKNQKKMSKEELENERKINDTLTKMKEELERQKKAQKINEKTKSEGRMEKNKDIQHQHNEKSIKQAIPFEQQNQIPLHQHLQSHQKIPLQQYPNIGYQQKPGLIPPSLQGVLSLPNQGNLLPNTEISVGQNELLNPLINQLLMEKLEKENQIDYQNGFIYGIKQQQIQALQQQQQLQALERQKMLLMQQYPNIELFSQIQRLPIQESGLNLINNGKQRAVVNHNISQNINNNIIIHPKEAKKRKKTTRKRKSKKPTTKKKIRSKSVKSKSKTKTTTKISSAAVDNGQIPNNDFDVNLERDKILFGNSDSQSGPPKQRFKMNSRQSLSGFGDLGAVGDGHEQDFLSFGGFLSNNTMKFGSIPFVEDGKLDSKLVSFSKNSNLLYSQPFLKDSNPFKVRSNGGTNKIGETSPIRLSNLEDGIGFNTNLLRTSLSGGEYLSPSKSKKNDGIRLDSIGFSNAFLNTPIKPNKEKEINSNHNQISPNSQRSNKRKRGRDQSNTFFSSLSLNSIGKKKRKVRR